MSSIKLLDAVVIVGAVVQRLVFYIRLGPRESPSPSVKQVLLVEVVGSYVIIVTGRGNARRRRIAAFGEPLGFGSCKALARVGRACGRLQGCVWAAMSQWYCKNTRLQGI